MPDFIIGDCKTESVNFFHSANYTKASFSTGWDSSDKPADPGVPVYLEVLNSFHIPFREVIFFPKGSLPGIDIFNMDAIQAIRLSLAEGLIGGSWFELVEDEDGFVFLVDVLRPRGTVNLDVRLCIPSTNSTNIVNIVVVRGYKKPPQRYAGPWKDVIPAGLGAINPDSAPDSSLFTVDVASLVGSCVKSQLATSSTKSYKDPFITTQFGSQTENPFYKVKEFESIMAWAVDIDGMPEGVSSASYSFSNSTTWYYKPTPPFPVFSKKDKLVAGGCDGGSVSGGKIVYYEGKIIHTPSTYKDRYGEQWPLELRPVGVFYTGYKITGVVVFGSIGADDSTVYLLVNPVHEFNKLSEGSQWAYSVSATGNYEINVFYTPSVDEITWDALLASLGKSKAQLRADDGRDRSLSLLEEMAIPGSVLGVWGGAGGLGYAVTGMWVAFSLDRPSVTVTDPEGEALGHLSDLRVRYSPLILKNEPAPIAYAERLSTEVVDLSEGLMDSDPTTCQNFTKTSLAKMQEKMQGNVVDVSLPFLVDGAACAETARVLYDYMHHTNVPTYTLTCGPDSNPILGVPVEGFRSDLRINSITYSYQDSSSYTIEVTLGPVFTSIGSWNNGAWLPKSVDVTREAIVLWTAGDGVNYRVQVQGLGEYDAINSDPHNVWKSGDRVTVTVYNIPQETI